MRNLYFYKPSAIRFGHDYLSDHNRSEISIDFERIESEVRTQFGRLRRYHKADKREFSMSWNMLPETYEHTVDGGMGAREMKDFFLNNIGELDMTITYDIEDEEVVQVVISSFSLELMKRWNQTNYYSASLSLKEV